MANKANEMNYNIQTVESLKASGRYAHAGALAAFLGMSAVYGCHFGFRSELPEAIAQYKAGYFACIDALNAN